LEAVLTRFSEGAFLAGRFLLGLSFTISSTVSLLWIIELSHPKKRGLLVGITMTALPVAGGLAMVIVLCTFEGATIWAWKGAILVNHSAIFSRA
jgi:MFS family permease